MPVALDRFGRSIAVRVMPICNETFQTAYSNGFALYTPCTFTFALRFLRTDSAANGRERGCFGDYLVCAFKIALFYFSNKFGYMYIYGTAGYARHVFAAKAAHGLVKRRFLGVAYGDLVEIVRTNLWIL